MPEPSGITDRNRHRLEELHRHLPGAFTVAEAATVLDLPPAQTRRLLAALTARGWLSRIRRGLYTTVPLGATAPSSWHEDPWIVAAKLFAPCYIGGWSACEHWGFTEQIFRDIVVFTTTAFRIAGVEAQGTRFLLRTIGREKSFGLRVAWRGEIQVQISDPTRTIIDILDDPAIGGGIRHVAEVLVAYFDSEYRNDSALISYTEQLGNRTVYKRLGYLLEATGLPGEVVVSECLRRRSSGLTYLDPSGHTEGSIVKRWNLRLNAVIPCRSDSR